MVRFTLILSIFLIGSLVVLAKPTEKSFEEQVKECETYGGRVIYDSSVKCPTYQCILDEGSEWPDLNPTKKCES
ncbi:hypothetical protein B5X24_HaOG202837 [Helicoverpa armigera]|nr:hypothetical protein B5X24_HaOG202837 [Helicoverpa armigera]